MGSNFDPMAAVMAGRSLPQAPRVQGPQLPRIGGTRPMGSPGGGGYYRSGPQAIQGLTDLVSTFAQHKQQQKQKAEQQVQTGLAAAAAGLPVDKVKLAKAFKQTDMGDLLNWDNPVQQPGFQMEQPGMSGPAASPREFGPGGGGPPQPPGPPQAEYDQAPQPPPPVAAPPQQLQGAQVAPQQPPTPEPQVPMSPAALALMGQRIATGKPGYGGPLDAPPDLSGGVPRGGVPEMQTQQTAMPGMLQQPAGKTPGFFGRVAERMGIKAPYVNPNSQGAMAVDRLESQSRQSGDMGRQIGAMKQYAEMGDLQNKISQNKYNADLLGYASAYASRQWPSGEKVSQQQWMRMGDILGASGFFKDYKPADMLVRSMTLFPDETAAAYGQKGGEIPMHAFLMHSLGLDEANKAMAETQKNLIQSGMSAKNANTAANELYNGKPVSVALPASDKFKEQAAKNLEQFQKMYAPQDEKQAAILNTVASKYPMAIAAGDWGFLQNLIGTSVMSTGTFEVKGKLFDQEMKRGELGVSRQNAATASRNATTNEGQLAETKSQNAVVNQGRMTQNLMDVMKLPISDEQKAVLLRPILAQGTGLNVNNPRTTPFGTNWLLGTPLEFSNPRVNTGQPQSETPASQVIEAAKRMLESMGQNVGDPRVMEAPKPNGSDTAAMQAARERIAAAASVGMEPDPKDLQLLQSMNPQAPGPLQRPYSPPRAPFPINR